MLSSANGIVNLAARRGVDVVRGVERTRGAVRAGRGAPATGEGRYREVDLPGEARGVGVRVHVVCRDAGHMPTRDQRAGRRDCVGRVVERARGAKRSEANGPREAPLDEADIAASLGAANSADDAGRGADVLNSR